jgi:hypothetical protein
VRRGKLPAGDSILGQVGKFGEIVARGADDDIDIKLSTGGKREAGLGHGLHTSPLDLDDACANLFNEVASNSGVLRKEAVVAPEFFGVFTPNNIEKLRLEPFTNIMRKPNLGGSV